MEGMEEEVKPLTPANRLIVACDIDADRSGSSIIYNKVMRLVDSLADTGVVIELNSALRACGYDIINKIKIRGLDVMADLKLNDIPETMALDGSALNIFSPSIVTAMCSAGPYGLARLNETLPARTQLFGVTVLTSFEDRLCRDIYGAHVVESAIRLAGFASEAGITGVIASPKEAEILRKVYSGLRVITPGIRPEWSQVKGDDQKRTTTPREAIMAGADRIVIGRPITGSANPREAVMRTIEEIDKAHTDLIIEKLG